MNKLFSIGIPTINQADSLEAALKMYVEDFPNTRIYVMDNGLQKFSFEHPNLHILKNYEPRPISQSWNLLAKRIFLDGCEYALILNDDIYLGCDEQDISKLLTFKSDLFCAERRFDMFSAFILPKKTFDECGGFDEEYTGCYYEDSDYLRTLQVVHNKTVNETPVLNSEFFKRNSSVLKNPKLAEGRHINENRYIRKWGGALNAETFKTPFNK